MPTTPKTPTGRTAELADYDEGSPVSWRARRCDGSTNATVGVRRNRYVKDAHGHTKTGSRAAAGAGSLRRSSANAGQRAEPDPGDAAETTAPSGNGATDPAIGGRAPLPQWPRLGAKATS